MKRMRGDTMGAYQNNPEPPGKRGKKRGSVRNNDRLAIFLKDGRADGADWGGCDPKWQQAVIVGITALGGAVTFGLARNGGAHFLTLLLDDSRQTLWFNGNAVLNDELQLVVATIEAMA